MAANFSSLPVTAMAGTGQAAVAARTLSATWATVGTTKRSFGMRSARRRAVSPKLDELHRRRDDVAVVKVDINRPDVRKIDWQSPVAKQFALRSIPHFKIFDGEGKLISEGNEARDTVYGWLKR